MKLAQDIILRPVITEETMTGIAEKKYAFRVAKTATKPEIREAVEKLFDVKVKDVNTMNVIHYMHDRYAYERVEMALDREDLAAVPVQRAITNYQAQGYHLAIHRFGRGDPNDALLEQLRPDIVRLDASQLQSPQRLRDIARKTRAIGARLLLEDGATPQSIPHGTGELRQARPEACNTALPQARSEAATTEAVEAAEGQRRERRGRGEGRRRQEAPEAAKTEAAEQIKEVILAGMDAPLETALALERKANALLFASRDQKEGMQAFIEKRPPRFEGR